MRALKLESVDLGVAAVLALVVAVFFAPVASHGEFVLDAEIVVRDDLRISEGRFSELMRGTWWGDRSDESIALYRPVTKSWFAMIAAIAERESLDARDFGRGNLLLHALVTALRYLLLTVLLSRLSGRRVMSTLAALVAAVHGVSAESVVGVVGAAELLAAIFTTLAWLAVARGCLVPLMRSLPFTVLAAVCWVFALGSKESAVLWPVVLTAHVLIVGSSPLGERMRRAVVQLSVFGLAAIPWLVFRHDVTGDWMPSGEGVWGGFTTMERVASACAATTSVYLRALLWPFGFSPNITHQDVVPAAGLADMRALAGLVLWAAATMTTGWALMRRRIAGLLGLAALCAALPTSNLLVGIGAVAAQRFFFVPLFAVTAAAVLGAEVLRQKWKIAGLAAWALIVVFGALGAAGSRRVMEEWKDDETLYAATLASHPQSVWALQNLVIARHFVGGVPGPDAAAAAIELSKTFDDYEDDLAVIPSSGRLDRATRVHAYKLLYNRAGLWSQIAQGASSLPKRVEASTRAADDLARAERYAWSPTQVFESRLTLYQMRLLEMQNAAAAADAEEREILVERAESALQGVRVLADGPLETAQRVQWLIAESDMATLLGDAAGAKERMNEALEVDGGDPDLRRQLAERAMMGRKPKEALEHLDAAIAGGRAPLPTYLMAAEVAANLGLKARCRGYLEAGLALDVTQPGEWQLRSRMTMMLEQVR